MTGISAAVAGAAIISAAIALDANKNFLMEAPLFGVMTDIAPATPLQVSVAYMWPDYTESTRLPVAAMQQFAKTAPI